MLRLRELLAGLFGAAAHVAAGHRAVALSLQHQLQRNWCWAACTSSVSGFYDPRTTWGQCAIVNAELRQRGCCADGRSAECDVPWYLDRALRRTGNFNRKIEGPAGWAAVRKEVDGKRPVGVRIGWNGGGGHFVMITGYRATGGAREVDVQDPWTGSSRIGLGVLANDYKGAGRWTHTYLTRR